MSSLSVYIAYEHILFMTLCSGDRHC